MNIRYVIGSVFALVLLGVGGYFVWNTFTRVEPPPVVVEETPPPVEVLRTYASSTLGISVKYPPEFTIDDTYAYDQFGETKLIHGIKFGVPAAVATGTNLSLGSGVSVEWLPNARNCTGDIYVLANVPALLMSDEGVQYSVASSSEAAAGNRYEEIVYALPGSKPCTAVRYFIHSTVVENYPEGTVREFDRAALLAEFDKIRRSLTVPKQ